MFANLKAAHQGHSGEALEQQISQHLKLASLAQEDATHCEVIGEMEAATFWLCVSVQHRAAAAELSGDESELKKLGLSRKTKVQVPTVANSARKSAEELCQLTARYKSMIHIATGLGGVIDWKPWSFSMLNKQACEADVCVMCESLKAGLIKRRRDTHPPTLLGSTKLPSPSASTRMSC